jgi:hypothetical protein
MKQEEPYSYGWDASPGRFEAIMDPCYQWTVFDSRTGCPAEIDCYVLIGLGETAAFFLCSKLNRANGHVPAGVLSNLSLIASAQNAGPARSHPFQS